MLFDKTKPLETMVAGATLRPVDDAFTLDVMLQQLGVGHFRLQICMSPAAYLFCDLVVNDPLKDPSATSDQGAQARRKKIEIDEHERAHWKSRNSAAQPN
jgi:hypothetical protein